MVTNLKELSKRPLIVAPILGNDDLFYQAEKAEDDGADLIEVRIDTLPIENIALIDFILIKMRKTVKLPFIATFRSPKEQAPGTKFIRIGEEKRQMVYESVLRFVDFIDIELSADTMNRFLTNKAHKYGKKVILSYHNFHSLPSSNEIKELSKKFQSLHGDFLKIAGTPKNMGEAIQFMFECSSLKKTNPIFIPMKEQEEIFRIIGFTFGSLFTYGFLEKSNAPGQIQIKELSKRIKLLYPR
jgi:3-dehydroquinate dehydratase I